MTDPAKADPAPAQATPSALAAFGGRLVSHSSIYGVGAVLTLVLGLVQVAVLTRYLPPAEFGRLAILFFFAALLAVLFTLAVLQGSFMYVFGAAEDGDDDGGDDDLGDQRTAGLGQKKRALATGLALTSSIAVVGGLAAVAAATPLSVGLLSSEEYAESTMLAAACGSTGAIWRFVVNVPRLERRPIAYLVLSLLRPVLVLGIAIPLVATGHGIDGVLAGTAGANVAAIVAGLLATRRSYSPAFELRIIPTIVARGAPFIPVILSFWVIGQGDLFLLSRYVSAADVGIYRVASRVASPISYLVSSLFQAWNPLRRSALGSAAEQERGREAIGATFATYFLIGGLWVLLGLYLLADTLVRVAPSAYSGSAAIVPLLGAALFSQGFFTMVYRISSFNRRLLVYASLAVVAAVTFIGCGLVFIPLWEGPGAAAAAIVAFAVGTLGIGVFSQRGRRPIPFQWARMGAGILATASSFGLMQVARELLSGLPAALVETAVVFLLTPALFVLLGAVPRAHLRPLLRIARAAAPERGATRALYARLAALPATDVVLLEQLLRHRLAPTELAADADSEESGVHGRFVGALRRLVETGERTECDPLIGAYLLSDDPVAERDSVARQLSAQGASSRDIDALDDAVAKLRKAPAAVWESARTEALAESAGAS